MRYLILAQCECTATALGAWVELIGERAPNDGAGNRIIIESRQRERDGGLDAYHSAVEQIETAFAHPPTAQHGDMVALVDCVKPSKLSAVSEGMGWDHLVALLILTFPEVKWVFGIVMGDTDGFPLEEHSLPSLLTRTRRDPIFDPTGLREWVRERTNERLKKLHDDGGGAGLALRLPKRRLEDMAAAIDDEVDYATMHAYTAYRYGYRADVITTWALMDERFGTKRAEHLQRQNSPISHGYTLLMEDMRLTFADKPGQTHLSNLGSSPEKNGRDHYCPLLANDKDKSGWRYLITSGQMGQDGEQVDKNRVYLEEIITRTSRVCYKPLGGLCEIWTSTGLRTSGMHAENNRGNAQGFRWPPEEVTDDLHNGHGSPGKLGMAARVLVERATLAQQTATSAGDLIGAALLASEAAELLGGKTPTLTLSALSLKHELEVRAECTFIGAGFHFGLDQRLKEIKDEVKSVCHWFHEDKQTQAKRDAMATIINRLKLAFSEAGQLEEEERCLIELRWLNRLMGCPACLRFKKLWMLPVSIPWWIACWIAWGTLFYGELLLRGFVWLLSITALWLVGIAALANRLEGGSWTGKKGSTVVGWFFGGNGDTSADLYLLSWIAVGLGVFHLGILMSYLYSLISRK